MSRLISCASTDPVEFEPDQGLPLLAMPPYRAAGLLDRYSRHAHGAPLGAVKRKSKTRSDRRTLKSRRKNLAATRLGWV
jgi:hypothetical protein